MSKRHILISDLGNVMVKWDPIGILTANGQLQDQASLAQALFGQQDWVDIDLGTKRFADIVPSAARRTGLAEETLAQLYGSVPASLTPIAAGVEVLEAITAAGYRAFGLSNMGMECADHLAANMPFWDRFEDVVISGELHTIKPDPQIYLHLLKKHGLAAADCVFIDDSLANIQQASRLGFQTVHVTDHQGLKPALQAFFDF